jgi:GT2 family glycosyltransferase
MPPIILCCPTYRKFDLCVKMIESANLGSVAPTFTLIIDNSAGGFTEYCQQNGIDLGDKVHVFTPDYNLGVARAWNYLLMQVKEAMPEAYALVVNDDIIFKEDTIQKFSDEILSYHTQDHNDVYYEPILYAGDIGTINAYSMFCVHPSTFLRDLGPFDETIWPAYFDDNDMDYRRKLKNLEMVQISGATVDHIGSATLAAYTEDETETHHHQFRRNQEYFIRKWGGLPGEETYTTPFNGESVMRHMVELHIKYGF